ncbi:DNA ligase [compost metagenome]
MSATIITMADFEATKAQAAQAAKFVRRPVSVLVHWSESGAWGEGEIVPFAEFEVKAASVALAHVGGGYQKTKVTVSFDDGETYEGRVDLSATSEQGFTDHCLGMLDYYATEQGQAKLADCGETNELIAFLRGVDFGADAAARVVADREAGKIAEEREQQRQEAEKKAIIEARHLARMEAERQADEWRDGLVIPADAKAVIVARLVSLNEDRSDPYADYYQLQDDKVIILAWSKHTRDLFAEMRKAAKNDPATAFLADPADSQEHREKYSMGKGYYLTDRGFIRTGWIIEKVRLWSGNNPAKWIPHGEIAIPGYVGRQSAPAIEAQATPVIEVVEEQAEVLPVPVKPKFTAQQVGGVWSVTIAQGEECHQFDGITAASLAEACRIAWAMLTQPTPPDDDPSGQPLPVEPAAEQAAPVEQGATAPTLTHIHQLLDTGRLGEPGEVFQLCLRHDKAPASKIPAIGIASVKKDGMFVAALHCKGRPWFFARSGQLMTNTDLLNIPAAVLDALQASPNLIHQFEFKADALRQSVFNGAVSPVRVNPVDPEVAPLLPAFTPWLINVIPVADFIGNGDGQPLAERKALAKAISERHGLPMPEHRRLSWGDAMAWFAELVEQNEEGIVYDNPEAAYAPGARRADLSIKRARELRLDLRCVGVAEGKGKHAGVVGTLLFEYEGTRISADLGEGWDYADRVRLMVNPAEAVGQVFEVYAFDVSELGSLRQAKVGQPRPDKVIAD